MSDSILQLWAAQHLDAAPPTTDALRGRAAQLHRQGALRDGMEYAAGGIVIAIFGYFAWAAPTLWISLGCLAMVAGVGLTLRNLHRHRVRRPEPDPRLAADCRAFLRAELVRQRDALNSVWRWYLLPMEPGMLLFLAAVWAHAAPSVGAAEATVRLIPVLLIGGGSFLFVHLINRFAARSIQGEIDALDAEGLQQGRMSG